MPIKTYAFLITIGIIVYIIYNSLKKQSCNNNQSSSEHQVQPINLQNTLTRDLALEFEENETPDSWATAGTFPTPTSSDESDEKIHLIAYWQLEQERLQAIIEDSSLT